MADYYNVTTHLGDAEIAAAIASNNKLAITHIAFGDGNGSVPTPQKTRTSLVREVHRQAVTKYERHPTNANWIIVETIIPSHIGGFWVREMGVIANGKLISHGSHAPFEKVADATGVSEYRLKFTLNIRDGNVVNITLDQSLIYASQAWVEENYIKRNEIIDNLSTNDATKPLSAKQGKNLEDTKVRREHIKGFGNYAKKIETGIYFAEGVTDAPNSIGWSHVIASQNNGSDGTYRAMKILIGDQLNLGAHLALTVGTSTQTKQFAFKDDSTAGNAATATKLQTARTVSYSGAATGSFSYDGSGNSSCILTLANSGVTASTYGSNLKIPVLTVNQKGLITSVSEQQIQLVDDLTTGGTTKFLSAEQGKKLQNEKMKLGQFGFGSNERLATTNPSVTETETELSKTQMYRFSGDSSLSYGTGLGWTVFGKKVHFIIGGEYDNNLYHRVVEDVRVPIDNRTFKTGLIFTSANPRTFSFSGDAAGSLSFDGTRNVSAALTLSNVNSSAGTWGANALEIPTFTLNNKGLITSAGNRQFPLASTTQSGAVQLVDNLTTDDATKAATAKQVKNLQDNKLEKTANAVTATKLQTARTVQFSGAATGSFGYDGSGNSSCILTLANSGVTASTYGSNLKIPVLTVNQKGLITSVSEQQIQLVDDLTTGGSNKFLSAEQGKKLQDEKMKVGQFGFGANAKNAQQNPAATADLEDLLKTQMYSFVNHGGVSYGAGLGWSIGKKTHFILGGYLNTELYHVAVKDNSVPIAEREVVSSQIFTSQNPRTFSFTGDAAGSLSFDGTRNVSASLTLSNVNSSAGTWGANALEIPTFTLNNKGLITSAGNRQFPLASTTQSGAVQLVDNLTTDDATKAATAKQVKNLQDNKLEKTANAESASKLQTARTVSYSGAATGSFSYDGSGNSSCILTLANSGVTASTYGSNITVPVITVNAKGIISSVSNQAIRVASTTQTGVVQLVDDLTTDDATKAATAKQVKNLQDNKLEKTANAASASKLTTARNIAISGPVQGNADFDGSDNISISLTANSENLRVVTGSGYTITYDDARRIAIIEMTLWNNASVISRTTFEKDTANRHQIYSLPIVLKKRLSIDIQLTEQGSSEPDYYTEAFEWICSAMPDGYRNNSASSKFFARFKRFWGGSDENVSAVATIVGIF